MVFMTLMFAFEPFRDGVPRTFIQTRVLFSLDASRRTLVNEVAAILAIEVDDEGGKNAVCSVLFRTFLFAHFNLPALGRGTTPFAPLSAPVVQVLVQSETYQFPTTRTLCFIVDYAVKDR